MASYVLNGFLTSAMMHAIHNFFQTFGSGPISLCILLLRLLLISKKFIASSTALFKVIQ